MGETTPGPWHYVPSTEHHGPYVESSVGGTICDCYMMSNPTALSVRSGGDSKPILFFHEMADQNARLIAAAPDMLAVLKEIINECVSATAQDGEVLRYIVAKKARAAIAKATGG